MCARHLPHYLGTSSVYAVTLIDRALRLQGITSAEQRVPHTGVRSQLRLPVYYYCGKVGLTQRHVFDPPYNSIN